MGRTNTSKTFKEAFPRSVPITQWKSRANRCFVKSDLSNSELTGKIVTVFTTASRPLTIKQVEKKVYGQRLRTMNPSTHARKIVKRLVWDYPSLFVVDRMTGVLKLTWR